jgi:sarcosine oxidase delta subunit
MSDPLPRRAGDSEYLEMVLTAAMTREHPHLVDDWTPRARRRAALRPPAALPAERTVTAMSTSPTRVARPAQARATEDVERYLRALFARESPGAFIEVRYRHHDDMRRHFFAHTDTFAAARTIARLGLSSDVYVGVAARRSKHAGGKDAIRRVWTLWADLDDVDAHQRLDELPVAPAILIASGSAGHRHAYWPLARPVSIAAAETANRRLAAHLHADTGAVTNAATILRPLSVR